MHTRADWEVQSLIVETLFRVCPKAPDQRQELLMRVFDGLGKQKKKLQALFEAIRGSTFAEVRP